MVRINIIPVNLLADQHLIAEWNECFMLIGITLKDKLPLDPPKEYTLGKGHINFFRIRLPYIFDRMLDLANEMENRGYKPDRTKWETYYKKITEDKIYEFMLDYIPCYKDFKIIVERITIKIKLKPNYYTYKKSVLNIEVWNKMYADFLLFHQNF